MIHMQLYLLNYLYSKIKPDDPYAIISEQSSSHSETVYDEPVGSYVDDES